jgi:hypothetical protein
VAPTSPPKVQGVRLPEPVLETGLAMAASGS